MTQPSEGQRRQELLFALEEFKKNIAVDTAIDDPTFDAFDRLATILLKGL